LATKAIKLNYFSPERFFKDYERLGKGKIFLPTNTPLPLKTRITLNITVPDIEEVLTVECGVIKAIDEQTAAQLKKPTGMVVGLIRGPEVALKELNHALGSNTYYRMLLNLPDPTGEDETSPPVPDAEQNHREESIPEKAISEVVAEPQTASEPAVDEALTLEWIREAIAQEEAAREKESAAQIAVAPVSEKMQLNQVLSFDELSSDVQYLVNTEKMAKDVQAHIHRYVNRILTVQTSENAAIMAKLMRRILPVLIEKADWQTTLYLSKATDKAAKTSNLFKNTPGLPANPLIFVFKGRTQEIVAGYENADESQRAMIDNITDFLGTRGVEILSKVLSDSEDRGARKNAMDALTKKGDLVRNWIFKVLDDPEQKWFLIRNALMLLGFVGKNEKDIEHARKLLRHGHPRVRDEALNVVISLKAHNVQDVIITALGDVDDKVRWRAMSGLADLSPVSEGSVKRILDLITAEAPDDDEKAVAHYRKTAQLIRALGGINDIPNRQEAEDTILEIARQSSEQKKGLLKRIKKTTGPDLSAILSAAITTLGNIGGPESESFLEKLAGSKSPQAQPAQKAANNIKLRNVEQPAADPPQRNVKVNPEPVES